MTLLNSYIFDNELSYIIKSMNIYQYIIDSKEEICKYVLHDLSFIDSEKVSNDLAIFLMVDTSLEEMSEKSLSRQSSCLGNKQPKPLS